MANSAGTARNTPPSTNEITRIAREIDQVFRGDPWHGPALMALLANVDPATAAAHPVHDGHSIWEIVLHLTAWKLVVPRRLRGEAVELKHHQDWPAITHFEDEGWQHALSALESAHNALLDAVLATDPKRLSEFVPGKDYDCALMLHGAAHHDAYHAGQIALLKKAD